MNFRIIRIKPVFFLDLSLICYICCNAVRLVFYRLTGFTEFSYTITYFFIYVFLLLYLIRSKKWFTRTSMIITILLLLFLVVTCFLHSEYLSLFFGQSSEWQTDRIITQQVFAFSSGFTILPIICLYNDADDFMKTMTIASSINAAYIIMLYLTGNFSFMQSTITSNDIYSGSMGYSSLIPLCIMFYIVINSKKLIYKIISGIVAIIMLSYVLLSGVRGCLLCIIIFIYLFLMLGIDYKFKKIAKTGITLAVVFSSYLCLKTSLLIQIGKLLSKMGISSRSINALINGVILDDNGRDKIKDMAYVLISEGGPFGLGFCSSRYYYSGSYPHNIFLELWIDMGYVGGTALLIMLLLGVISFFKNVRDFKWRYAFIVFFSCAFGKLLVSASLWSETLFWETIAVGIAGFQCCRMGQNERKKYVYNNTL